MSTTVEPVIETTSIPLVTSEINVVSTFFFFIIFIITFVLGTYHGIKVCQDLCTKDRKSVSHRRHAPDINKWYKTINILTFSAIFFNVLSVLAGVLSKFSTSAIACDAFVTLIIECTVIAKAQMYVVFLARLYSVYERSAYSYGNKCISFFLIILVIYNAVLVILVALFITAEIHKYGDDDFPNFCNGTGGSQFLLFGALMVLQDIVVAIAFMIAFMLPLKKTLKNIEDSQNDSKVTRKIVYAGTKTAVLTGTTTFSTLFITLFIIITGVSMLTALDPLINTLCMMFMTAYYKDAIWYQRCCCCCICCCNKLGQTDTSEAIDDQSGTAASKENEPTRTEITLAASSTGQTVTDTKSIDTMSQLRVAGTNDVATYNTNNNGGDSKLEITPEPPTSVNNDDEQP